MKKMEKDFLSWKIIGCFLIIFALTGMISGFSIKDTFDSVKNKLNPTIQKIPGVLGFDESTKEESKPIEINALEDLEKIPLVYYFLVGLIAGFYLWLWYVVIINFDWKLKEYTDRWNPLRAERGKWIQFIAGRLWKVLLIGVGYAVLMQIPIINRILQIITLDLFLKGFFWTRTIILALEIGFIPAFLETFRRARLEARGERMVSSASKAIVSAGAK